MLEVRGLGETGDYRAEAGKQRHSLADQAALTTEVTCAEPALRDVQDEGVGSRAEVTGALSQGETGGAGPSHDSRALGGAPCPQSPATGPPQLSPGWPRTARNRAPGFESWLCPS